MTLRRTHEFKVARDHAGTTYVVTAPRVSMATLIGYGTLVRMGPGLQTDNPSQDDRQWRGLELRVASPSAADEEAGAIRVYRVTPYADERAKGSLGDAAVELIGTLTYTYGTTTGSDAAEADRIDSGKQLAVTMSWDSAGAGTSPVGIADFIAGVYSGGVYPSTYSPGNGACAVLAIPDVGSGDVFIDYADALESFAVVSLRT